MRPAPGVCDRCGMPVGAFGTYSWCERQMGTVSFAWADCGCGQGTTEEAIRRRAARISPQLERAARAAITRYRKESKQRAAIRMSPAYQKAIGSCSCPDCRDRMSEANA